MEKDDDTEIHGEANSDASNERVLKMFKIAEKEGRAFLKLFKRRGFKRGEETTIKNEEGTIDIYHFAFSGKEEIELTIYVKLISKESGKYPRKIDTTFAEVVNASKKYKMEYTGEGGSEYPWATQYLIKPLPAEVGLLRRFFTGKLRKGTK